MAQDPRKTIEKTLKYLRNPQVANFQEAQEANEKLDELSPHIQKVSDISERLSKFLDTGKGEKGDKGETGEKGEKGDSVRGEKGEQGVQGIQGLQGEKGEQGVQGIQGIPGIDGNPGRDGKDGRDGQTPKTHAVAKEAVKLLKELKGKERLSLRNFEEGDDIIGQVRLHSNMMKNMPKSLIDGDQRWGGHGGSASSSTGSALATETPVGTIDNANTSFTVTNIPLWIVVNGATLFSGGGFTYGSGTITTDSTVGTGGSIYSVYASTVIASGTVTSETPVGTIDNSNVTFTVGHQPVFIVVNGSTMFSGGGYTYSGGTLTLDSPVGTGGSLYSLHN
jgi:hypothetical protein